MYTDRVIPAWWTFSGGRVGYGRVSDGLFSYIGLLVCFFPWMGIGTWGMLTYS